MKQLQSSNGDSETAIVSESEESSSSNGDHGRVVAKGSTDADSGDSHQVDSRSSKSNNYLMDASMALKSACRHDADDRQTNLRID